METFDLVSQYCILPMEHGFSWVPIQLTTMSSAVVVDQRTARGARRHHAQLHGERLVAVLGHWRVRRVSARDLS